MEVRFGGCLCCAARCGGCAASRVRPRAPCATPRSLLALRGLVPPSLSPQDAHTVALGLPGAADVSFFAVYDGHGGSLVSSQASQQVRFPAAPPCSGGFGRCAAGAPRRSAAPFSLCASGAPDALAGGCPQPLPCAPPPCFSLQVLKKVLAAPEWATEPRTPEAIGAAMRRGFLEIDEELKQVRAAPAAKGTLLRAGGGPVGSGPQPPPQR